MNAHHAEVMCASRIRSIDKPAQAASLLVVLVASTYGLFLMLWPIGLTPLIALAPLASAPLAIWLCLRMHRGDWARSQAWNSLNFWSAGLLMAAAGFEGAAFLFHLLAAA